MTLRKEPNNVVDGVRQRTKFVTCPHCEQTIPKPGSVNHIRHCKRTTTVDTGPSGYYKGECTGCGRRVSLDGHTDTLRRVPRHCVPDSRPVVICASSGTRDFILGDPQ